MKINFTKQQFKTLMEMIYVANWMINAHRVPSEENGRIDKYDEFEKYIYSFAKECDLDELVDEENGEYYPSLTLEEDRMEGIIEEYDEETFWEDLMYRMAERDFHRNYSQKEIVKMEPMERIKKDHPFLEKYGNEIHEHGIERFEIIESVK